ncbi:hypothetical protein LX69_00407 [Breznakibacter xylanolyticus]|uniref:Uncharacterized protein n=1 Tax=Breznakibacter xylanolyticus TaxID=990 RepID=A0A2W7NJH1_9BACT|nr:hypothetical protein [Breznakibacter xylanolyticus]PZX20408.1 hypothetical protein LX69_00407 [Breznakibacter xylanolyticus]
MKKYKWLLYAGMVNIWAGLMLRIFGVEFPPPALFFSLGGTLKVSYLVVAIRQGRFKPGIELVYLAAGLVMLALGIYVRKVNPASAIGIALVVKAVLLKATFLFLMLRKMRAARLQPIEVTVKDDN